MNSFILGSIFILILACSNAVKLTHKDCYECNTVNHTTCEHIKLGSTLHKKECWGEGSECFVFVNESKKELGRIDIYRFCGSGFCEFTYNQLSCCKCASSFCNGNVFCTFGLPDASGRNGGLPLVLNMLIVLLLAVFI